MTDEYLNVVEKFITKTPTFKYDLDASNHEGSVNFELEQEKDYDYDIENYSYKFTMGADNDNDNDDNDDNKQNDWKTWINAISEMKLSELNILNSTDYLRAIYDFDELVDAQTLAEVAGIILPEDYEDTPQWADIRQKAIQALVINSIEKSGRFKVNLRNLKKAQINIDKLDDAFVDAKGNDSSKAAIGKKYVEDLFKSYNDLGLLSGINFIDIDKKSSSSGSKSDDDIFSKKDALEAKLDAIVNIDTSKPQKMKPRQSHEKPGDEDAELVFLKKYLRVRMYLEAQFNAKKADLLSAIAKIMEDCCYAQQRYVEAMRNKDDASIMLGFYPEMAEPIITYTTIAQSLNKILDTMKNINECDIDVACDAGISNIAQFVKQVYDPSADDGEDVGGLYNPVKYSSYFKFNKNTDLAYWKTIVYKFDTFCKYRGDCMFCTEGPRGMVLIGNKQVVRKTKKDTSIDLNILPYLSKITGFNTSFGAGYLNWYRTISDYTGDTLWVPPSIKAMGTYILTDKQYNWWDAPAGMRRGVINMAETSFNPNKDQAGDIYDANWNYAIHYVNDGIIQEGQKTFQTRQSALDRVNVRRLIGRIKRYVYHASRQFLYEPHTQAIREKYVKTITPFFQDLMNRGGLYGYKIICDNTNNTPEVIDRNELRVKIGIKPVKAIEFIIIDLCVLNTGASWTEMDSI